MSRSKRPTVETAVRTQVLLALGGLLLAGVSMAALFGMSSSPAVRGEPYVWPDLAGVFLLCAVPFALALRSRLSRGPGRRRNAGREFGRSRLPAFSMCLLCVVLLATLPAVTPRLLDSFHHTLTPERLTVVLHVFRAVFVLTLVVVGVALASSAAELLSRRHGEETERGNHSNDDNGPGRADDVSARSESVSEDKPLSQQGPGLGTLAILLGFAVIVPRVYLAQRAEHHSSRLVEHLQKARMGDGLQFSRELAAVLPTHKLRVPGFDHDKTATTVADEVGRHVQQLEAQAAQLKGHSSRQAQLNRAELLGQLGRTGPAIALLKPLAESPSPDTGTESDDHIDIVACNLLGTIYEFSEDWPQSRQWYETALKRLSSAGNSRYTRRPRIVALKGVAYTEQKLGRFRRAEQMYQELLRIAPTAEHHYLLAQFYKDTGQAESAYEHAARAARLSPARYETSSRELIDHLLVYEFGCLNVFTEKQREESREQ